MDTANCVCIGVGVGVGEDVGVRRCVCGIYITPLKGNYSEVFPTQRRAKESHKKIIKRAGQVTWERAQ